MFDDFNENGQAKQVNWGGWTPPWMEGQGPQGQGPQGWQGPRGPFGPGQGWDGPRGPFGPGRGFGGPRGWGRHGHHGHGPFGPGFGPGRFWNIPEEFLALRSEAAEVARLFAIASRGAFENKERLTQLRSFLDRSRKELSDMIYGSSQATQGQTPNTGEKTDPNVEQV
jgi:hypothetical protein